MKRIVIGFLAAAFLLSAAPEEQKEKAAQATPKKSATAKSATKTKTATKQAPAAVTIPPGAVEFQPGAYRWVDAKGKAWVYTKTPFGIMKGPETPNQPEPIPTDWIVTDEGDSLTFERPWPFGGVKRWTKKKNDLTDMEAAVWKRAQDALLPATSAASGGKN